MARKARTAGGLVPVGQASRMRLSSFGRVRVSGTTVSGGWGSADWGRIATPICCRISSTVTPGSLVSATICGANPAARQAASRLLRCLLEDVSATIGESRSAPSAMEPRPASGCPG